MGLLHIQTTHLVTGGITLLTVRGLVTAENAHDLQYHAEALYFLRRACEVHVNLDAMSSNVDDHIWIDKLAAAARTAALRRGRLCICRPPRHFLEALAAAGVERCDSDHRSQPGNESGPNISARRSIAG